MKKKVALVLIMVMFVNMIAWAEESDDVTGTIIAILALVGIVAVIIIVSSPSSVAEADAPDDGIRLVSMQTVSEPKTPLGSFIKLLQHVELGQNRDNSIYAGLRFQL